MAHFLFIDESGHDERESPNQALAGICVRDADVWPMIQAIIQAENDFFGCRYGRLKEEFKGKKFLKRKVFNQAKREAPIPDPERRDLAKLCIADGSKANFKQITALAQAKLAFVERVFAIAIQFQCKAIASLVKKGAPKPGNTALRKDYSYLFERFFYICDECNPKSQGVIVFDELEKSQSKILIGQMEEYFTRYWKGRQRAQQIVPQPFFVHSDLTTLVQVADLIAYILVWGYEFNNSFAKVAREELRPYGELLNGLKFGTRRAIPGHTSFKIRGFVAIDDLRGAEEKAV